MPGGVSGGSQVDFRRGCRGGVPDPGHPRVKMKIYTRIVPTEQGNKILTHDTRWTCTGESTCIAPGSWIVELWPRLELSHPFEFNITLRVVVKRVTYCHSCECVSIKLCKVDMVVERNLFHRVRVEVDCFVHHYVVENVWSLLWVLRPSPFTTLITKSPVDRSMISSMLL